MTGSFESGKTGRLRKLCESKRVRGAGLLCRSGTVLSDMPNTPVDRVVAVPLFLRIEGGMPSDKERCPARFLVNQKHCQWAQHEFATQ